MKYVRPGQIRGENDIRMNLNMIGRRNMKTILARIHEFISIINKIPAPLPKSADDEHALENSRLDCPSFLHHLLGGPSTRLAARARFGCDVGGVVRYSIITARSVITMCDLIHRLFNGDHDARRDHSCIGLITGTVVRSITTGSRKQEAVSNIADAA
jgi:hypothetical protein